MSSRILLVDGRAPDPPRLAINLKALGYQIEAAQSGEEALQKAASSRPDAVILDLGLPGIDGIDVIRGLRGWSDVPIIVPTVREAERDKNSALDGVLTTT